MFGAIGVAYSLVLVAGPGTPARTLGELLAQAKAQPGQVAPVSHGCPTARFDQVAILNTVQEGGR